ncbi:hypothetical protein [Gudongella sp. DL1XJH-153]|uniref:TDE2712 family protein n=1 Tax=Gudongella sp. DL1XJH-153 TaxID=3409804 RepID=UPI003BB70029
MASITVSANTVEMMIFFWESVADREKVSDKYLMELAEHEDLSTLYDEEFSKDSFRKVLSAISNRELMNNPTKKESRFWNLNMWMLEDMDNMREMVKLVKTLNLDHLKDKLSKDVKVIFIPGTTEEYKFDGDKLIINFFKISINPYAETNVTISGKEFNTYIEEKVLEI